MWTFQRTDMKVLVGAGPNERKHREIAKDRKKLVTGRPLGKQIFEM